MRSRNSSSSLNVTCSLLSHVECFGQSKYLMLMQNGLKSQNHKKQMTYFTPQPDISDSILPKYRKTNKHLSPSTLLHNCVRRPKYNKIHYRNNTSGLSQEPSESASSFRIKHNTDLNLTLASCITGFVVDRSAELLLADRGVQYARGAQ